MNLAWKSVLPRMFLLGLVLGGGFTTVKADGYKCPNCYRCPCALGTDVYGFTGCLPDPQGGCNPSGDPCCNTDDD